MKNLLLIHVVRMSKLFTYAFLIQCMTMSLLFAWNGNAQIKSIEDVMVSIPLDGVPVRDAFKRIEGASDFNFVYLTREVRNLPSVFIEGSSQSLYEILAEIAQQTGLEFKQINENIHVQKSKRRVPEEPVTIVDQDVPVSGVVTDSQGEPIPGVTVSVQGTAIGTATDLDGRYTLSVPEGSTLVFSFIGFESQIVTVGDQSVIDISLDEDMASLDEVVVVGYGAVKKSDLTGSISSIKAEDLEKQGPRINFIQALQGAAPGLNITQTGNSASSGSINVRIRGQNSILASNNPLVILDGVPFDGNLNTIDQSTIESIDVLKDASSSAIYGARGANGVILITTKKGQIGRPTISYDGSYGVKQIYNIPRLLTGPEHWDFGVERYGESSITGNYPTRVQNFNDGVSTDWVKEATRPGVQNKHTVGISGGAAMVEYFLSGTYMNVNGISKGDDYKNISGRLNLIIKPTDWLEIGTRTQYSFQDNSGLEVNFAGGGGAPHSIGNLGGAFMMNPLIKPYDDDGNILIYPWPEMPTYPNPLSNLNVLDEDVNRTLFSNNFIQVNFPFIDGLSYKLNTGTTYQSASRDIFWGNNTLEGIVNNGQAFSENLKMNNSLVENLLFYNRSFGSHNLGLTVLYSSQKDSYDRARIFSRGFPTEVLSWYQPGSAEVVTPSRIFTQQTYVSQMGRLIYSYREKYLLTATLRRDGYSAFGSEKKFGVFPSLALGWNVKSESFLAGSDLISQFKLRASYGMNGNQAISPYATLASVNRKDYLTGPNGDLQGVGFLPNSLENNNLGWETTRSVNFGIDYGFYNNRITGTIDLYQSNTQDLLLNRAISVINGVTSITSNIGEVENIGIEFLISTVNIARPNLEWTTNFNIAHNKNSIVDLYGDGKDDIGNSWFIGHPIDVNFGYKYDGVWQLDDNIENSHQPNAQPGDVKIRDVKEDGEITPEDRTFIGQRSPKYTFGLTNTIRYKNFNFNFMLTGRQGITRNNDLWDVPVYADAIRNTLKQNWWNENNPTNDFPANRDNTNPFDVNFYKDASFIRLNNVNLGYDFGQYLNGGTSTIKSVRVILSVINALTFTKWNGLDPEYSSQRAAPLDRVYSLGINVVL